MKMFQLSSFITMNYMIGNFMFSLNRKHLLVILLSLELIVLNVFFYMYVYVLFNLSNSVYFMMMFMILSVCEGVLGVSILVYMIRVYGNDYVGVYSISI
uniref:NADH dehydrogenase subunit 4L n=1 Tax=Nothopsyche ruficollis TaxID=115141 RepID=UPI0022DCDFBF|nr:NADH dehydrogenase subunit 4L [Nothopsyche ruficollis]UZZ44191.1 NADH dehydrogenase subunit 4L [Nothopsyche ruficollis]